MGGNVEAIKERLDIAEVIGGYIKLEKAGANYKAKCPFHNEKTASFHISTSRQGYYCFGCGAKGDIFTFVQEMEGTDFRGALKTLAERAGIELKTERREDKSEADELHQALEVATEFFEMNLSQNKEALDYLKGRGVSVESIKTFRLGLAHDSWREFREHANSLGIKDDVLLKSGLIKRSEESKSSEPYDTFRGRIVFPLCDARGKVIAFSGRALQKDLEPKYLNSPDTPLFNKSEVLYGFDKAREEIRKKNYAVLVEGQLDLVLSHQAGVKNTVASSGTAFTQMHLEKLKKISPRIILAFDNDDAGKKASYRSTALALSLGMEVKIADIRGGKDPADLVKEDEEKWREILRTSKSAVESFINSLVESESSASKIGKEVENKILPLIASMISRFDKEDAVSKVSSIIGKSPANVAEMVMKIKPEVIHSLTKAEVGGALEEKEEVSRIQELENEIKTIEELQIGLDRKSDEYKRSEVSKKELNSHLVITKLEGQRNELKLRVLREGGEELLGEIVELGKKIDEERRNLM